MISKVKSIISLLLILCIMWCACPINAMAQEYEIGDTIMTYVKDTPIAPENAIWVLIDSDECYSIEHKHNDACYYKSCDHKNGHLNTCYGEVVEYTMCEHSDDTEHTSVVTLADVVTIKGTNVTWVTTHPAYQVVFNVYKAAYDEAYAKASFGKDYAGKIAGVAELLNKKFCYTVSASAEPLNCTHGACSDITGSCYSKICILSEHQHVQDCNKYTWELKSDINNNNVADDADTYYTIQYVSDNKVIFEENVLVGLQTPRISNPSKDADAQYTYQFVGWDNPISETVTENKVYTAVYTSTVNKYTVTWFNYDGTVLKTDNVAYGQLPSYQGEIPKRQGDNVKSYVFSGWTPSVNAVTGDIGYTATFTTKDVHSVDFYINNEYVKTEYVVDGEKVNSLSLTKSHYTLSEWHKDGDVYDFNTGVNSSFNLHAEWILTEAQVVVEGTNLTYTLENEGIYPVQNDIIIDFLPDTGYVISDININDVPATFEYNATVATLTIHPDNVTEIYNVVVNAQKAELVLNDTEINVFGTLNSTTIFDAIYNNQLSNPNNLNASDVKVEYLAYSIELLGRQYDWWVTPETDVSLKKFLDQYGLSAFAEYIPANTLPHNFGTQSTEYVRVSFDGNDVYPALKSQAVVTLADKRIPSRVNLKKDVVVTYGATEQDILKEIFINVTAGNTIVTDDISNVAITVSSLNAGTRTAIVSYGGDNVYGISTETVEIKIIPQQSQVDISSRVEKYGNTINVSELISSNANCIEIVTGIKTGDNISANLETIVYVNLPELIDVDAIENETVKTLVKNIMHRANETMNGTMTIEEFGEVLNAVLPYIEQLEQYGYNANLSANTINSLAKILNQISETTGVQNMRIKFSIGDTLTLSDAGIYMVAGVVSDTNYTTSMNANYVIIYPDGYKTELEWLTEDENGLITINALRNGYDLSAYVSSVAEGNIKDATAHLKTLFIGIDKNGNFVFTDNQNELDLGAYTEIAFIADCGNTMYYAQPIIRSFVVTVDMVNLYLIDENGNINHNRIFEYSTNSSMTAMAFDRNTNELIAEGEISYWYFGMQTNGVLYRSNTSPTYPGLYTVVATYTNSDKTVVGATAGSLIIKQIKNNFSINDTIVEYDGQEHFAEISNDMNFDFISIILNGQDVNIVLPNNWNIHHIDAFKTMDDLIILLQGLDLPTELTSYRDDLITKLKEVLISLQSEYGFNEISINNKLPVDIGEYAIFSIAYGTPEYEVAVSAASLVIKEAKTNTEDNPTFPDNPTNPETPKGDDGDETEKDNIDKDKGENADKDANEETKEDNTKQELSPETGDTSNVMIWFVLLILSCITLIFTIVFKKKLL